MTWEEEVCSLLMAGNLIGAIKTARSATGWGLQQSKMYVNGAQMALGMHTPKGDLGLEWRRIG